MLSFDPCIGPTYQKRSLLCLHKHFFVCKAAWLCAQILQVLNSKLVTNSDAGAKSTCIQTVILYEGSITNFGSQLHGFDIGTCLEVIL